MPTLRVRSARMLESPVFRTFLLSLMALLFLAFWLLCSHQVRQYESRRTAQQVQLTAFGDCLQYVVDSTIASCTNRLGRLGPGLAEPAGGPAFIDSGPNALPAPPRPPQPAAEAGHPGPGQVVRVVAHPRPARGTR